MALTAGWTDPEHSPKTRVEGPATRPPQRAGEAQTMVLTPACGDPEHGPHTGLDPASLLSSQCPSLARLEPFPASFLPSARRYTNLPDRKCFAARVSSAEYRPDLQRIPQSRVQPGAAGAGPPSRLCTGCTSISRAYFHTMVLRPYLRPTSIHRGLGLGVRGLGLGVRGG